MIRFGVDISNYTSPLTQRQIAYLGGVCDFVIIGLQSTAKARGFLDQLRGVVPAIEWYVDLPGRSLELCQPGDRVWIDIEQGCFVRVHDVNEEQLRHFTVGVRSGIYCNQTSLGVLDGPPDPAWQGLPLWHAQYWDDRRIPSLSEFRPYAGWQAPTLWQYSERGAAGINCDLNVSFEMPPPPPPPEEPYITGLRIHRSDGSVWNVEAVPPPDRR